ncbi:MAG: FAD-dependent monooxygenase [Deltaproteobacteria bacterium]|nr:FAD-dependent monooxygenase [Deltaproteobacteria bacterium]
MRPQQIFDVLVIGGGLAGSAASFHLASHGYSVAIVEREAQAHHKICGEFLSQETLPYLKELGIDLDALKASSLNAFSFYSTHFNSRNLFDAPARGLSRYVLDEACLEKAGQAGCLIFRGEQAESYEKDSSQTFLLKTSRGILKAKTLFLATGKHELKKMNIRQGLESSAIGFKMHCHLTEEAQKKLKQDIALFFFKGGYGGLCKIENQIANFCFIIDKKRFRNLENSYETTLSSLQKENPSLGEFLKNASPLWPKVLAMSGIPYGYLFRAKVSTQETGIYPLGDQFAVIPSLTGSGMAIALYTARKAFTRLARPLHIIIKIKMRESLLMQTNASKPSNPACTWLIPFMP